MALGTLASRGTGFLRTLMLVYALGATDVANAYNNANTLPNAVYDLMLGGILTSVVVPLLVSAAKRDKDRGEAYTQRMFTLATVALFALTVVATLAAGLLVDLYAHALTGAERHLTVIFAFFFIPQIFFYGVSSMAGGVLNARNRFAAPMWTPVINNIVVIGVLLMFIATGGIGTQAGTISASQVELLGFGTTLGIIAQTAAMFPALHRAGFRWRPRFDFRRAEVAEIRRMAAPLFGYILTTQVSFLVVQNVANAASVHPGTPYDSFSAYSYAWQLFQLPYAIVGISVITALLPRMSAHAAERRYSLVRSDFSTGVRLSSVIVVPAALLLIVLGGPLAEFLIAHGSTTVAEARYIGEVFGIFSLGLVPYMVFQLLLRVFYALHDSRTPMFVGVAVMATNIAASLLALNVLPAGHVVEGLGVAFGLANVVGCGGVLADPQPAARRPGRPPDRGHPGPDARGRRPGHAVRLGGHLHGRRAARPRAGLRADRHRARWRRRPAALPAVRPRAGHQRGHRPDGHREDPAAPVTGGALTPADGRHSPGYREPNLVSLTCNGLRWQACGTRRVSRRGLAWGTTAAVRAAHRGQIRGLGRRVEGLPRP